MSETSGTEYGSPFGVDLPSLFLRVSRRYEIQGRDRHFMPIPAGE